MAPNSKCFERQRDTLTAANAERDHAAADALSTHRVQEPRREHGSGCANRMTMSNSSAFDRDDVLGHAELLRNRERHGRESLVDLDALHICKLPSGPRQRLTDGRNRAETDHAGFAG